MQNETITPKELRKIMKLSIAIDVALGFYVSRPNLSIDIDQSNNWNPEKVKSYKFELTDLKEMYTLVNAYAILFKKHFMSVRGSCSNKW